MYNLQSIQNRNQLQQQRLNQDVAKFAEILNEKLFLSHLMKRLKENYLTKVNIDTIPIS